MAREYAQIRLDIWTDDNFRNLSRNAQHLYLVLTTSPTLSYCGVADWRPGRIAASARGWTAAEVRVAAAELVNGLFIVLDEDSEEVLVRSFIKHDGLLRNPKTSVSMANAFGAVASKIIRGVIVHQLRRLHEKQPELKAWAVSQVAPLLTRESVDPSDLLVDHGEDLPEGLPHGLPVDLGEGLPQEFAIGLGEPDPEGLGVNSLPAPAPAPTSSSNGGYVTGERHQPNRPEPSDGPPPKTCPRHRNEPDPPNCGACADARRLHDEWQVAHRRVVAEAQVAERRRQAEATRAERAACSLCDDDGYRNGRVCDHDPQRDETNRRGIERARAALLAAQNGAEA